MVGTVDVQSFDPKMKGGVESCHRLKLIRWEDTCHRVTMRRAGMKHLTKDEKSWSFGGGPQISFSYEYKYLALFFPEPPRFASHNHVGFMSFIYLCSFVSFFSCLNSLFCEGQFHFLEELGRWL